MAPAMMPIRRLLVANRGEIACRIIRTARRMGIHSVAVYSSADAKALHVAMADEAILIGEPMPADSYLNIDRIIQAALDSDADAIHSGYGFLAENPRFAEACASNGIVFVGPPANAIRMMGMKGTARAIMQEAGVPVLPGINELVGDIAAQIEEIGYPLLIKPSAGGGGKGMRIVRAPDELGAAIESARREAASAFGDSTLMAERYLDSPRHVEVQIFADAHGHCIHLNERDCSLQRRHQKIIEEAPAPGLSPQLRAIMGASAVKAAKAIGYIGAGTVEFLLADDNRFYFMEMNTRLQVEHPVTEAVTGFDLVQWQIDIASGSSLPVSQQEVPLAGHAIEARLYAEDPLNGFLPSSGRIERLELAAESERIRIDNGVREGDHVGVYYDPMLMKVIARGESRIQAIDRLRDALLHTRLVGLRTNRDFLCHMLDYLPFRDGPLSTDFLDQHLDRVFTAPGLQETHAHVCAAALALETTLHGMNQLHRTSPWYSARNFRLSAPHASTTVLMLADKMYEVEVEQRGDLVRMAFDGVSCSCRILRLDSIVEFTCNDVDYLVHVFQHGNRLTLVSDSRVYEFSLPLEDSAQSEEEGNVQAPMSGKIVAVLANEGASVTKGDALVVIEAMKMEHTICAPGNGKVLAMYYAVGDLVDEGCELLAFEAESP